MALIQPSAVRRQRNERVCTPWPSIIASSTSRSNGAVLIGIHSIVERSNANICFIPFVRPYPTRKKIWHCTDTLLDLISHPGLCHYKQTQYFAAKSGRWRGRSQGNRRRTGNNNYNAGTSPDIHSRSFDISPDPGNLFPPVIPLVPTSITAVPLIECWHFIALPRNRTRVAEFTDQKTGPGQVGET